MLTRSPLAPFALAASLSLFACIHEVGGGEGAGETGGPQIVEDPCRDCAALAMQCLCSNDLMEEPGPFFCWSGNPDEIDIACFDYCLETGGYTSSRTIAVACATPETTSCRGWNPEAEVTYYDSYDLYVLDHAFVAALVEDPRPLWSCDDALVVILEDGGFEVQGTSSGGLLHELGLVDGDSILSLNGYELIDVDDVALAFVDLWFNQEQVDFTLEVERQGTIVELHYWLWVSVR